MAIVLNSYRFATSGPSPLYVGSSVGNNSVILNASTLAGDLVVIYTMMADNTGFSGGAGGWSPIFTHNGGQVYYKTVVSGDLGVALTALASASPGDNIAIVTMSFRNVSTVTQKSSQTTGSDNTLSLTGFVKAGGHKGIVSFCTNSPDTVFTPPSGFTATASVTVDAANLSPSGSFRAEGACRVDGGYVSNDPVIWSWSTLGDAYGAVLELT